MPLAFDVVNARPKNPAVRLQCDVHNSYQNKQVNQEKIQEAMRARGLAQTKPLGMTLLRPGCSWWTEMSDWTCSRFLRLSPTVEPRRALAGVTCAQTAYEAFRARSRLDRFSRSPRCAEETCRTNGWCCGLLLAVEAWKTLLWSLRSAPAEEAFRAGRRLTAASLVGQAMEACRALGWSCCLLLAVEASRTNLRLAGEALTYEAFRAGRRLTAASLVGQAMKASFALDGSL
eukprot:764652-Hanusia_phi.AAC.9